MTSLPLSEEGLRIVVADRPLPSSSPLVGLAFRTGFADDALITAGWTDILLDAALSRLPVGLSGGAVLGPLTTVVFLSGPEDEALTALRTIARRLTEPVHDDVLAATLTACTTGDDDAAVVESYGVRFGVDGMGSRRARWLGHHSISDAGLAAYARHRFVRSNALVIADRPLTGPVDIVLPDGPPLPPDPVLREQVRTPARYETDSDDVVFSGVVPRSSAARLTTAILATRLVRLLRHGAGVSYSPTIEYSACGSKALVTCVIDAAPGAHGTCAETVVRQLGDLSRQGPTSAELEEHKRAMIIGLEDSGGPGLMINTVMDMLTGAAVASVEDLCRDTELVTVADVARTSGQWLASGLLGLPAGVEYDLPEVRPGGTDAPLPGTRHDYIEADGEEEEPPAERPTLISAGPLLQSALGPRVTTVSLPHAAGVAAWPDGRRSVVRVDGAGIAVEPNMWSGGERLVAAIDRFVPPHRFAWMEPRDPDQVPRPTIGLQESWMSRRVRGSIVLFTLLTLGTLLIRLPPGNDLPKLLAGTVAAIVLIRIATLPRGTEPVLAPPVYIPPPPFAPQEWAHEARKYFTGPPDPRSAWKAPAQEPSAARPCPGPDGGPMGPPGP